MFIEWFKSIETEVNQVDHLIECTDEVPKESEVVGTLTELQQKTYTLWRIYRIRSKQLELALETRATTDADRVEMAHLNLKAQIVLMSLWAGIEEDLKIFDKQLAIYKGFKIGTRPPPKMINLGEFRLDI